MNPDEFRKRGHELVDWIASYLEQVEERPVQAQVEPGQVFDALPARAPEQGESWDAIFSDVDRIVLPGVTHWQHPGFFGYFPCQTSAPSILGDLLSSGLGVNGMMWATSPACTELEMRVLDWLADALGLPEGFTHRSSRGGGVIQGTASEATLVAMVAARHRAGAADPEQLVAYTSAESHSSVEKAARICGLAPEQLRKVEVDDALALDSDALGDAIERDVRAGRIPFFCCATLGTTSSTAFDPLRAMAGHCSRHGIWLHVDAAFAGSAFLCPEFRGWLDGVEACDSFDFNPHKWLRTGFDCSALFVRDGGALVDALSVTPEYLRNPASESGRVVDYRDWQIPLGRRFRALKLWFVLRHFGLEALRAQVRMHVRWAEELEASLRADTRFEIAAPRTLSLVCFRLCGEGEEGERRNRALLERVNASGELLLTHTTLPSVGGRTVLRVAVGAALTEQRHVRAAGDRIRREADAL